MLGVLAAECLSEMEQESGAALAAGVRMASLAAGLLLACSAAPRRKKKGSALMMMMGEEVPHFYIYKLPIVRLSGCYVISLCKE